MGRLRPSGFFSAMSTPLRIEIRNNRLYRVATVERDLGDASKVLSRFLPPSIGITVNSLFTLDSPVPELEYVCKEFHPKIKISDNEIIVQIYNPWIIFKNATWGPSSNQDEPLFHLELPAAREEITPNNRNPTSVDHTVAFHLHHMYNTFVFDKFNTEISLRAAYVYYRKATLEPEIYNFPIPNVFDDSAMCMGDEFNRTWQMEDGNMDFRTIVQTCFNQMWQGSFNSDIIIPSQNYVLDEHLKPIPFAKTYPYDHESSRRSELSSITSLERYLHDPRDFLGEDWDEDMCDEEPETRLIPEDKTVYTTLI